MSTSVDKIGSVHALFPPSTLTSFRLSTTSLSMAALALKQRSAASALTASPRPARASIHEVNLEAEFATEEETDTEAGGGGGGGLNTSIRQQDQDELAAELGFDHAPEANGDGGFYPPKTSSSAATVVESDSSTASYVSSSSDEGDGGGNITETRRVRNGVGLGTSEVGANGATGKSSEDEGSSIDGQDVQRPRRRRSSSHKIVMRSPGAAPEVLELERRSSASSIASKAAALGSAATAASASASTTSTNSPDVKIPLLPPAVSISVSDASFGGGSVAASTSTTETATTADSASTDDVTNTSTFSASVSAMTITPDFSASSLNSYTRLMHTARMVSGGGGGGGGETLSSGSGGGNAPGAAAEVTADGVVDLRRLAVLRSRIPDLSTRAVVSIAGAYIVHEQHTVGLQILSELLEAVLEGARDGGEWVGDVYFNMGIAHAALGKFVEAAAAQSTAMHLYARQNDADGRLLAVTNWAATCLHLGRSQEVAEELSKAITEWESNPVPSHEPALMSLCYAYLGQANRSCGNVPAAVGALQAAVVLAEGAAAISGEEGRDGSTHITTLMVARLEQTLGALYNDLGDWHAAFSHHDAALTGFEACGDIVGQASVCDNWGVGLAATGMINEAIAAFQDALALWSSLGPEVHVLQQMESRERMASVLFRAGAHSRALFHHQEALRAALSHGVEADRQRLSAKVESCWNVLAAHEHGREVASAALSASLAETHEAHATRAAHEIESDMQARIAALDAADERAQNAAFSEGHTALADAAAREVDNLMNARIAALDMEPDGADYRDSGREDEAGYALPMRSPVASKSVALRR